MLLKYRGGDLLRSCSPRYIPLEVFASHLIVALEPCISCTKCCGIYRHQFSINKIYNQYSSIQAYSALAGVVAAVAMASRSLLGEAVAPSVYWEGVGAVGPADWGVALHLEIQNH